MARDDCRSRGAQRGRRVWGNGEQVKEVDGRYVNHSLLETFGGSNKILGIRRYPTKIMEQM